MSETGSKAGKPLSAGIGRRAGGNGVLRPAPSDGELNRFDPASPSLIRDHGVWYLRDRSRRTQNGKRFRRNFTLERYGPDRPILFPPELRSGLAEDLLDRLPKASFDLVYLDPPYGETDQEWDRAPDWPLLARLVSRVLKPTGQVVLHISGEHHIEAAHAFRVSLRYRFHLVWVRSQDGTRLQTGPIFSGTKPLPAHELVYVWSTPNAPVSDLTFHEEALARPGRVAPHLLRPDRLPHLADRIGDVYTTKGRSHKLPADVIFIPRSTVGEFSAAKPLDLTRRLILLLSNPGDTVLDPYAGSGTTLKAAFALGRRSLGIEAAPERFQRLREWCQRPGGNR